MGSHISDWAEATGPIYMGANSSWEMIWLAIAMAVCVLACILGAKHEFESYKKLGDK